MIVLDSSFILAYYNTRDTHHAQATRAMIRLLGGEWGRMQLLEYVFLEVVTVLRARVRHETAVEVADILLAAAEVDFVPCSDIFATTLATFRGEAADLSFTDAAIVTVARQDKKGHVATFDRDFQKLRGITVIPESAAR